MRNKVITAITAAALALTLTGCGEDEKSSAPVSSNSSSSEKTSSQSSSSSASSSGSAAGDAPASSDSSSGDNITTTASVKVEVVNDGEVNIVVKTDFLKNWGENKVVYLAFWDGAPSPDSKEILVCRLDQNQKWVGMPEGDYSDIGFDIPETFPDGTVTFNVDCENIEQLLRSSGYIWLHTEDYTGEKPVTEDLVQISDPAEIAKLFVGGGSSGSSSGGSQSSDSSSSAPETSEPSSSSSSGNTTPSSGESPASDFEYAVADGQMEIFGYMGSGGKVVIPPSIDGKNVEVIGGNAFSNLSNVTSVVIPDTVKEIEGGAFMNCTGLKSVKLPSGLDTIFGETFCGCTSLTSVEIPNGVTSVWFDSFADCTSLSDIKIPASVTDIHYGAFDNTPWKTAQLQRDKFLIVNNILLDAADQSGDITIPDGVTKIELCVPSISYEGTIIVPDSVTQIKTGAFGNIGARISYKGKTYDMTHGEEFGIYNY